MPLFLCVLKFFCRLIFHIGAGCSHLNPEARTWKNYGAVFIGSDPNALIAVAYLARAGRSVLVLERNDCPRDLVRTSDRILGAKVGRGSLLRPIQREPLRRIQPWWSNPPPAVNATKHLTCVNRRADSTCPRCDRLRARFENHAHAPVMPKIRKPEADPVREQIKEIKEKCSVHRAVYARRAVRTARVNKLLNISTLVLSLTSASILGAFLAGELQRSTLLNIALAGSALAALASSLSTMWITEARVVKLFYASSQFLALREDANSILAGEYSATELASAYADLKARYVAVSTAFIEEGGSRAYRRWYRNSIRYKIPGDALDDLPPIATTGVLSKKRF